MRRSNRLKAGTDGSNRLRGSVLVIILTSVVLGAGQHALRPADHPVVTILYTNDTRGYLEPCGCRKTGLGGLARRATLIQQVRAATPNVLLVDSGNLAADVGRSAVVLEAMQRMGYQAVGLGPLDLDLGPPWFEASRKWSLPLLLTAPRLGRVPDSVKPSLVCQVGGVRVGLMAVGAAEETALSDLARELQPILAELRGEANLVVLLSQLGRSRDEAFVKEWGAAEGIDLLIGNAEAKELSEPRRVGSTWLLPTSEQGQQVGRVEVAFASRPVEITWRPLPVDTNFPPDPAVEQIVGKYMAAEQQWLLDRSRAGGIEVTRQTYVPAEQCAVCHRSEYEAWSQQKHAQAVETLRRANRLVPECLTCHSEHYRRTGQMPAGVLQDHGTTGPQATGPQATGPRDHPEDPPKVSGQWSVVSGLPKEAHGQPANQPTSQPATSPEGVQCSACHGDGLIHSLLERKEKVMRHPGEPLCRSCHSPERDDDFEFERDLRAIQH